MLLGSSPAEALVDKWRELVVVVFVHYNHLKPEWRRLMVSFSPPNPHPTITTLVSSPLRILALIVSLLKSFNSLFAIIVSIFMVSLLIHLPQKPCRLLIINNVATIVTTRSPM